MCLFILFKKMYKYSYCNNVSLLTKCPVADDVSVVAPHEHNRYSWKLYYFSKGVQTVLR